MNDGQAGALFGFAIATFWWFFVAAIASKIEDWNEKRRKREMEEADEL